MTISPIYSVKRQNGEISNKGKSDIRSIFYNKIQEITKYYKQYGILG